MNNHEKRNLKNNIDKNFIYNKIEETKLHENNETLNSFEKSVNLINNDSKTILSDDKPNLSNYNLKRDLNNNFTANPKFYKNINHNKFQKKTIETVLENEKEENFTYYQYSDDNELINNPIVTFIFYKEENYEIIELENKKNNKSVAIDVNRSLKLNEELSISLNLNNFKDNVGFNFTANSNNNKNTHINEIIDNISQSEIFSNLNGVNDKSLDTLEKFNQNYKQKVNLENSNINENILPKNLNKERPKSEEIDGNSQTVKYKILYSEIIKACPIIQLSADTSKVC